MGPRERQGAGPSPRQPPLSPQTKGEDHRGLCPPRSTQADTGPAPPLCPLPPTLGFSRSYPGWSLSRRSRSLKGSSKWVCSDGQTQVRTHAWSWGASYNQETTNLRTKGHSRKAPGEHSSGLSQSTPAPGSSLLQLQLSGCVLLVASHPQQVWFLLRNHQSPVYMVPSAQERSSDDSRKGPVSP